MLRVVVYRRKEVRESGENGVARITMNRAVRNETTYSAIQIIMFLTSFWAIFKVHPIEPLTAIQFYFGTLGARAIIALLLLWASWRDMNDRKELKEELDKLHPETPPSKLA